MTRPNAYYLGGLLAALEHLTMVDRPQHLYELASIDPSHLIAPLNRATAQGGTVIDTILAPIVAQIEHFDGPLSAEDASAFGLGYYHQRARFRLGTLPIDSDEPPADERWGIRIEGDLKQWALDHGGSKLVRALLREARDRHQTPN